MEAMYERVLAWWWELVNKTEGKVFLSDNYKAFEFADSFGHVENYKWKHV